MTTIIKINEGWISGLGEKYHYIREGRSLCRRWAYLGLNAHLQADTGKPNSGDCKTCAKLVAKEREAGTI